MAPAIRRPKQLFPIHLHLHQHHAYYSGAIHLRRLCDSTCGYEPPNRGPTVLVNSRGAFPLRADRLCQVDQLFPQQTHSETATASMPAPNRIFEALRSYSPSATQ